MNATGRWAEVGSRVDGKFSPAIFRGAVGQKGTQCRAQDRFSSLEREERGREGERDGEDRGPERTRPRLHCTRRRRAERATLLPKRCSPSGLGKQRATGLPRSVINHFLLRKAVEKERKGERDSRAENRRARERWEAVERIEISSRWPCTETPESIRVDRSKATRVNQGSYHRVRHRARMSRYVSCT